MQRRPIKLTEKQKLKELEAFIALCFLSLDGYDDKEIANFSGKSYYTIRRLRAGQYTLDIRYRTVEALGAAAGLKLVIGEHSASVEMVRARRRKVAA